MKHLSFALLLALAGSVAAQDVRATKNDPAPGQEYEVIYKVGRFDSNGIFHGTDYNDRRYLSRKDCQTGYADTLDRVVAAAQEKAAAPEVQAAHLKKFKELYICQEILVDPNYDIQPQAVAEQVLNQANNELHAPMREQPQRATREESRYEERAIPLPPESPRYNTPARQAMPTRPYYVAEYVIQPGYRPYWVKYASVYESPAQCHAALRDMLREEQGRLESKFTLTARDHNAAINYSYQVSAFRERAKKLSCVSEGRF